MNQIKKSALTQSASPEQLLQYLKKHIKYKGVSKPFLYTAKEVVMRKEGHCWETSELIYRELTSLGYTCILLYIQDPEAKFITHTTVFYNKDRVWNWFELCLSGLTNITAEFNSLEEAACFIEKICKEKIKDCNYIIKIGYSEIKEKTTQKEYVANCMKWNDYSACKVKNHVNKPIYLEWHKN